MAAWVNKDQWQIDVGRYIGKNQSGSSGDHVHVTGYTAYGCRSATPHTVLPNGAKQPSYDVPNSSFATTFRVSGASTIPMARNRAYSRFVEKARNGPASLGEDLATWRQNLGMIEQRALSTAKAFNHLRKGEFRKFLKELKSQPLRKDRNLIRNSVKDASDKWLEYSFGWSPLFQDIFDAMHVLSSPLSARKASGTGSERYFWLPNPVQNNAWESFDCLAHVKVGAKVTVTNPNLFLLQQLGIANPVQTAWNLIPFSFVADWVFDVNTFLGSFSDLLGCGIQDPYTVAYAKANVTQTWWYLQPGFNTRRVRSGVMYCIKRTPGLPTPLPNFSIVANLGSSLKRAANAASLLGQVLTKHH